MSNQEKEKSTASERAVEWDNKHNVIPITIKTTPEKAEQFVQLCTDYNVTRRMVFDELIQEFTDGNIDVGKKAVKRLPVKIDHTAYLTMSEKVKETGYSKANVLSRLLDYFLDHSEEILDNMDVTTEYNPQELIETMQDLNKKLMRPLKTTDLKNPRTYSQCFGTWATALFIGGSIDYEDFIFRRNRNHKPFDQNELMWILSARVEELKKDGLKLNESNFKYPGFDTYKKITGLDPVEILRRTENSGII